MPIDIAIESLPKLNISLTESINFKQGQRIKFALNRNLNIGKVRVYDSNDSLIGLGVTDNEGIVQPMRIFN